ncbi:MAG: hypothetical protein HY939_01945, partial [Gammaproteobacteria bacterium]|nr:hypothetical protein [Gammaproteobacteria bacterium]
GEKLPIYEYSAIHGEINYVEPLSDHQVISLWIQILIKYALKKNTINGVNPLSVCCIEDIKAQALYSHLYDVNCNDIVSADVHYPLELRNQISFVVRQIMMSFDNTVFLKQRLTELKEQTRRNIESAYQKQNENSQSQFGRGPAFFRGERVDRECESQRTIDRPCFSS